MKPLKPGQFAMINGTLYRARKRTAGCSGCPLDDFFKCPAVKFKNGRQQLDCYSLQIRLERV